MFSIKSSVYFQGEHDVTCPKAWNVLLLTCSVQLFIWITYTTEQEEEMEVNNNKQVSESRDASVCKHQEII